MTMTIDTHEELVTVPSCGTPEQDVELALEEACLQLSSEEARRYGMAYVSHATGERKTAPKSWDFGLSPKVAELVEQLVGRIPELHT